MKTYAPNYYEKFRCIAGECRHSCCIGWDVYIDDDTLEKYASMGGELGKRVRSSLCEKDDGACFAMCADGRCPFLNERGLCDIILEKGEESISEICTEHPRFYNFFSDRTEVGLGLSCEEAARIILSQKEKTELVVIDEDEAEEDELWEEEAFVLRRRETLFHILQEKNKSIGERAKKMLSVANAYFPRKSSCEWASILQGLEMLDPEWKEALGTLCTPCVDVDVREYDTAFENLLIYFIYRHASTAADEADFAARISFAYLGFSIIRALCEAKKSSSGECSFEDLCDFARRYSAEIEYSPDNTQALLDIFEQQKS
jgi:lysine-N-methylase